MLTLAHRRRRGVCVRAFICIRKRPPAFLRRLWSSRCAPSLRSGAFRLRSQLRKRNHPACSSRTDKDHNHPACAVRTHPPQPPPRECAQSGVPPSTVHPKHAEFCCVRPRSMSLRERIPHEYVRQQNKTVFGRALGGKANILFAFTRSHPCSRQGKA